MCCEGVVKSIGVSNYTQDHLQELLEYCRFKPAVLQVVHNQLSSMPLNIESSHVANFPP